MAEYNNKYLFGLSESVMSVIASKKKFIPLTLNAMNTNIASSNITYNMSSNQTSILAYDYNLTNLKLSITSSSTEDSSTGTGIRTLLIQGLDTNFDSITELVSLNGITATLSTNNFQFVSRAIPVAKGSNFYAVGTIHINAQNNTNKHATILAGDDSPYINRFCTPRGHTAIVDSLVVSNTFNDNTLVTAFTKTPSTALFSGLTMLLYQGTMSYNDKSFTPLPEKSYFVLGAKRNSVNVTSISANLRYYFIKNTDIPTEFL